MSSITTAMKIAEATKDSITDFECMMAAAQIFKLAPSEEMKDLLFKYSAILSANVSTRVTSILMTESDFNAMVDEVQMFDEIERNVLGE